MPYHKYRPTKQWGRYNTRLFKKHYLFKLKESEPALNVPEHLKASGIALIDTTDPNYLANCGIVYNATDLNVLPPKSHKPARPFVPQLEWPAVPEFVSDKVYIFKGNNPLAEGIAQALVITKSVLRKGLPEKWLESSAGITFPKGIESDLVRSAIMHSQQWDSTEEALPKRFNPALAHWNYPRYYGIPDWRKNCILLDNLVRLASIGCAFSSNIGAISQHRHCKFEGSIRRDSDHIRFVSHPYLCNLGPLPLPFVCDQEVVARTADESLTDIYPIKAVIDLDVDQRGVADRDYSDSSVAYPFAHVLNQRSLHNICVSKDYDYKYPWSADADAANLLLHTFAAALAWVRSNPQLVRPDGTLNQPVVVTGLQCCRNMIDIVALQLNTLNLSVDTGVKNIAWIDCGNKLFSISDYWKNLSEVRDLDIGVFRKVLAVMYQSALTTMHSQRTKISSMAS